MSLFFLRMVESVLKHSANIGKYFQYHYTFTSFDVESLDLEDFQYNQVNITAFR
jgi:hypothetical protein